MTFDDAFIKYWENNRYNYKYFNVSMYSDGGSNSEVDRSTQENIPLIVISFGIVTVYLIFTLGSCSFVKGRPTLALCGVILIIIELFATLGLSGYAGIKFNLTILIIPYILLCIAINNTLIMVDTYDRIVSDNKDKLKSLDCYTTMMAQSGLTITITSIATLIAFASSAIFTNIYGIKWFCAAATFAVLVNYICQFLYE